MMEETSFDPSPALQAIAMDQETFPSPPGAMDFVRGTMADIIRTSPERIVPAARTLGRGIVESVVKDLGGPVLRTALSTLDPDMRVTSRTRLAVMRTWLVDAAFADRRPTEPDSSERPPESKAGRTRSDIEADAVSRALSGRAMMPRRNKTGER